MEKNTKWQKELSLLRDIISVYNFDENIKWGAPVYSFGKKNLIGIAAFKNYAGLWFFQGGLLKDENKKLVNAQEGKTKALRQWRFSSLEEIVENEKTLKKYISETIENHKNGLDIKPEKNKKLIIPTLLQEKLDKNDDLKNTFNKLSLSKRREYAEYISEAKRDQTKIKRLEKIIPMILEGKGLHDKYKNC
ncbi:MAG TPA: hypothetical protein ENI82_01510 [Bacteroidetes bacterium]|nr:hypothetical protein [Bacteroidota bacterium]